MNKYPCPECGHETRVSETRVSSGRIRRRRICKKCSHRLSTIEIPLDAPKNIIELFKFGLENGHGQEPDMLSYFLKRIQAIIFRPDEEDQDDNPSPSNS